MNSIYLFLAGKYLQNKKKEKAISTMIALCFMGIFIGAFSLSLVLAVMKGFEKGTHEKLRSIHPQIIMQPHHGSINYEKVHQVLTKEFPEVIHSSPCSHTQVMLVKHNATSTSNPTNVFSQAVLLKAIDPCLEQTSTTIARKVEPCAKMQQTLVDILQDNHLLLGKKLADHWGITQGDRIEVWYNNADHTIEKITLIVNGFFNTGIEEFDCNLAYCNFNLFNTLFPDTGVMQVQLELNPTALEQRAMQALTQRFSMKIYSWKDLYPALVSALQLQNYAMFFILALITLVASINLMALLFMYMLQKKYDLAILTLLGARHKTIRILFIIVGMSITICASLSGLLVSLVCGLILQKWYWIQLPDSYYVSHLPVSLEFNNFILVLCITLIMGITACWFATRKNEKKSYVAMLKGEL